MGKWVAELEPNGCDKDHRYPVQPPPLRSNQCFLRSTCTLDTTKNYQGEVYAQPGYSLKTSQ